MSRELLVETTNKKRKNEQKCDLHKVRADKNIRAQPFAFVRRNIKMPPLPLQGTPHHVHSIR
jgi:hypothetical protein